MAFRAYELNLIMRVQDRASRGIRRLSGDLGGINRAAQMQRDSARLAQNARSRAGIAERDIAKARLLGLNQANAQLDLFNKHLHIATQTGRISVNQAIRIRTEYQRILVLQRAMGRARTATHIGGITALAGGVTLAGLAGAASTFANFNRESVKAATQMRGVDESFASTFKVAGVLQTAILDLTRTFPASASEMAQSAFQISSGMDLAGNSIQRYNQTARLLRTANRIAVAGFVDLESATDTMITILNNFDPSLQNVNQTLNTLFAIVRFGRGDFEQFTPLFGGVAAAAKGAGQSLTEAGAALAFLTTVLPRPEAAASVRRALQIMGRREFVEGFREVFGQPATIDVRGVEKLRPLNEIIGIMAAGLGDVSKGGIQLQNILQLITAEGQKAMGREGIGLTSTEQARRGFAQLITNSEQYRHVLQNIMDDTTEFDEAFGAARVTPGVQWQVAMNQFKAFAIVVGQDVLPHMLRLIGFLTSIAHSFEDLSPRTRRIIGLFLTWGAAFALVGGAMLALIGSIARLIISLRLLSITSTTTNAAASRLLFTMRALSVIGIITVGVIAAKKLPDPTDLLGIGPKEGQKKNWWQKAIDFKLNDISKKDIMSSVNWIAERTSLRRPVFKTDSTVESGFITRAQQDLADLRRTNQASDRAANNVLKRWQTLSQQLTGLDIFGKLSRNVATQAAQIQLNLARATATGDTAAIEKALKAQIAFDQQQIKSLSTQKMTAERQKQLIQLYNDMAQAQQKLLSVSKELGNIELELNIARAQALGNEGALRNALNAQVAYDKAEVARIARMPKSRENQQKMIDLYNNMASAQSQLESLTKAQVKAEDQLASTRLRATEDARKDRLTKIDELVGKLIDKYQELREANKKAFEIFEGPISRGPIAQMFNQINDQLSGFGAKPIPIPVSLQIQDIQAQVRNFEMFQRDLETLRKRGAPPELIAELQAKGVEALPLLEGLSRAAPGAFKNYVAMWKSSQALIDEQTRKDMDNQLKLWKSYGTGIAFQIIQGLASDKSQALLKEGYKKWVVATFGGVLAKEMRQQIERAVAEWMRENPEEVKGRGRGKPKPARSNQSAPARTTQQSSNTNNYNENYTVHADGATPTAVRRAHDEIAFKSKRKGRRK